MRVQGNILFIAAIMLLLAKPHAAAAAMGRCTLEVDGHAYLNGPCNIDVAPGGSFSIGVGDDVATASTWFAYVNLDANRPGTASGFWNGRAGESHAGYDLGILTKRGACWTNSRAKVCAIARQARVSGKRSDQDNQRIYLSPNTRQALVQKVCGSVEALGQIIVALNVQVNGLPTVEVYRSGGSTIRVCPKTNPWNCIIFSASAGSTPAG